MKTLDSGSRDCVVMLEIIIKLVIPAQAGIQNLLIILDSPVSSTGQAHRRASLARNDKKVIVTQSLRKEGA
jgi:hypothetical protein